MSDEVRVHGVTVGRVKVEISPRRMGKTVRANLSFKPDHIGILHAAARDLDKEPGDER